MVDSYPTVEERPRRGRKVLIALLVLLLPLVVALVVADRVAAGVAERTIADQAAQEIAKQQISSSRPEVSVNGFPFLTQVAAGRYKSITISVRDAEGSVQGNAVRLPRLEIEARNVRASLAALRSGQGEVRAESVDGTGVIAYDSVAKFINQPGVRIGERDGKLAITAPVNVLGQKLTVNGTADLSVNKGQIVLRFKDLTAEGMPNNPLARVLLNNYAKQISIPVPLPKLPYGMRVDAVHPLPGGLEVTATARDVPLNAP